MTEFINSGLDGITTVRTSQDVYTASDGELVITDGSTVTLPTPTQGATVIVKQLGSRVSLETPAGSIAQQNDRALYEGDDGLYLVADDSNWYVRSDLRDVTLYIPDSGIARWDWEQSVEDLWNDNTASLNTASYSSDSAVGDYAIEVDNSNAEYATIPPVLDGLSELTIAFWAKHTADDMTKNPRVISADNGSGDDTFEINYSSASGSSATGWAFNVGGVKFSEGTYSQSNGDGNYYLIVGVYNNSGLGDGNTAKLFRNDGNEIASSSSPSGSITMANDIFVGGNTGLANDDFWNGFIDDIRIYNNALTSTEVSNLYNNESI